MLYKSDCVPQLLELLKPEGESEEEHEGTAALSAMVCYLHRGAGLSRKSVLRSLTAGR